MKRRRTGPVTRGMPKRFATSRCRARASGSCPPEDEADQKTHPLVDVERMLAREPENQSAPEMTLVDEIDRILGRGAPKPG